MKPSVDRSDGLAVIAFLIVAAVFWYARIIAPASDFGPGGWDFFVQLYPMMHGASRALLQGNLPLWNPYQLCGMPFLATVLYGVFYPFNVLFLLVRTEVAMEATVVVHLGLAGVFTYFYARVIALDRLSSAIAAVMFMLSTFVAFQALWFLPALNATVWLPVSFIAIEQIFSRRRFGWSVLLSLGVAMPIMCGWLQTWVYSMYAIVAYTLSRVVVVIWREGWTPALRCAGLVIAGVALGVSLAGVQLLPSAELMMLGPRRPGGLPLQQSLQFGVTMPTELVGDLVANHSQGTSGYIGMAALILIPLSLFGRDRHGLRILCLWGLMLWGLGVALTTNTPLFTLYRLLPGGTWFRVPQRILYLFVFAGAILAAIGLNAARRAADGSRRLSIAAVCVVMTLGVFSLMPLPRWRLLLMAAYVALTCGTALVRRSSLRGVCTALILIVVSADLFFATRNTAYHPFQRAGLYDYASDLFGFIKNRQAQFRTYLHTPWYAWAMPKQGTLRQIFSITDYEILNLDRYATFYTYLQGSRRTANDALPFAGALDLDATPDRLRLFDLMSVRFIVTAAGDDAAFRQRLESAGWQPSFERQQHDYVVYENPDVLPRAYVVHDWIAAPTADDAIRWLTSPQVDVRATAVLENVEPMPKPPATPLRATVADIVRYEPTLVQVETNGAADGYLVLTDTFYPGWKATVDGSPEPIVGANFLFRGVHVPAGRHRVAFTYDPLSFKIGASLTVAALAVIGAWVTGAARRVTRSPVALVGDALST